MKSASEPARVSRCGVVLTGLLFAVYFSFVGLVAFVPRLMGRPVIGVISLGLVAALVVIVFALTVTAIYVWHCRLEERS